MNVEQVAIDDLSAEILQELRPVVFAMRQRPNRVALFEELPGGTATGGAGRAGDENHGFRHRSPSFETCSLLTQQHYACIWIYVISVAASETVRSRVVEDGALGCLKLWTRFFGGACVTSPVD